MAVKLFTKQFAGLLPDIYEKNAHFLRTFGGTVQVRDGVKDSDTFLDMKTTDTEVVIQEYDTGANVAFGTGTGNSSRFGPRNEVKSVNHQVEYDGALAIHDGVDDFTVNDVADEVIAERLALHGEEWVEHLNGVLGQLISESASETLTGELTKEGIAGVFAQAHKAMVNNKVSKRLERVAYVNADVYNLIVDNNLATSAKQSSANIDNQSVYKFKGFILEELADDYFQADEQAYFAADNIGVVGIGISVARAIDSEDFAGTAIQGAAKFGKYLPEKNHKAVLKASFTEATPEVEEG